MMISGLLHSKGKFIFSSLESKRNKDKKSTIGDQFILNIYISFLVGNKHVSEIASMALDLLCASIVFKIPHMPNARLQLRMGIHSGSAIGIVSGAKTPKYL